MLIGHEDVPSIEDDAVMPENVLKIVRATRKKMKPPDCKKETHLYRLATHQTLKVLL